MTTPLQVQICSLGEFDNDGNVLLTLSCGQHRRPFLLSRYEVLLLYNASRRLLEEAKEIPVE